MLNISGIHEGFVLDHIQAGMSLQIYHDLKLDKLDCSQVFFHPGNFANQAVSVSLAFLLPLIPGPCLLQNRRILPEHIRGSGHIPADLGIPLHFPQLHPKGPRRSASP